ncbi:signal peptide peptidase SppA [Enterobacteriaceae endosymbiont of Neohaemonia nigricornis]|uniref:signal peptide peptidase SppA n=1 Tax=Enterobacteriaceae endosymbiont of Neohaemonia nigricornis TaxID=2675792 RepID=UPI00144963E1|nr:signal peptide peptidase SppA [Enterobacteriaceae endosymbiont of Neohaemonia nigricornis]QJC30292.1 signal peptide peptidase SppA [Enterobacteriaceae endosymbiont of Neohaemonia nigricornis]
MISLLKLLKYLCCCICSIINFIRIFIFNLLFIIVVLFTSIYFYNNYYKNYNNTYTKTILEINFQKNFSDTINNNKISNIFHNFSNNYNPNAIFYIAKSIQHAKYDKNITGIVLKMNDLVIDDISALHYLGKYLKEFKQSGKPIYAIGNIYTQEQYYIASFANQIILNPHGYIDLHGLSINRFYYKKFLNNFNVTSNIFKIGEYKSAIESFSNNNMSIKNKIFFTQLINTLWKHFLNSISYNRHIKSSNIFFSDEKFINILKIYHGNLALYALKTHLVDKLLTNTIFENRMIKKFGWDNTHTTYKHINIDNYIHNIFMYKKNSLGNIAVININGIIEFNDKLHNIINNIHYVYLNPNIKGLILKINSPGGSVLASQLIFDELKTLKNINKPIVVIMDSMAASGAYFISTIADYIISDPMTLTGSIGVFSIVNTIDKTLNNFGIYTDGVNISQRSNDMFFQPLSCVQKQIIQLSMENIYNQFIYTISHYRKQSIQNVKKISNGMVILGYEAKKYGLVDKLGDFDDAINKIAQLTHLKYIKLQFNNDYQKNPMYFFDIITKIHKNIFLYNKILSLSNINNLSDTFKTNIILTNYITYFKNIYSICTEHIY